MGNLRNVYLLQFIIISSVLMLFVSCGRIIDKKNEIIDLNYETVDKTATEFFEEVSEGINRTIQYEFSFPSSLIDSGLKVGIIVQYEQSDTINSALPVEWPLFDGKTIEESFLKYIEDNLTYPKEFSEAAIAGRVLVAFYIEKDGSLTHAEIIQSLHPLLDAETLRVINSTSSKWTPCKIGDKTFRTQLNLAVLFKMKY